MTWLDFALGSLATYYLALSVARQEGPFGIFDRVRHRLAPRNDWLARGVNCLICLSIYSALVVVVGLYALGRVDWPEGLLVWPALAGASVILDRYWQR